GFGSCVVQAMSAAGTAIAVLVATYALTKLSENQSWRAALLFGGLPIFLMIFIRAKMPESRLWSEYERLRKRGALPPEKAAERTSILEILRGASLKYFAIGIDVRRLYHLISGDLDFHADADDPRSARQSRRGSHRDADLVGILRDRASARRPRQ